MKALALAILFFPAGSSLLAHPGVGIVRDGRGNIFYTDLKQVWKISPDGSKTIVVGNVHTHELYLDFQNNLFGEHLWYEGDATKKWGHRIWRLGSDGRLVDVIPARQGFRDDYDDFHFVRDRQGNMYWADRAEVSVIRKRTPDGAVTSVVSAKFRDIRWMTVTPEGTVYLIDRHDLVCISPNDAMRTVARNLADRRRAFLFFHDPHAIMGLWTDPQSNVYAAISADRLVRRIRPDGRVDVVAHSRFPWSSTGGLVAPNGDLWLLEYSFNAARVRWIQKEGKSTTFD